MNRHGSVNRIYRHVWSVVRSLWIPVAETARGRGKRSSPVLVAAVLTLACVVANASPSGGKVISGIGSIAQSGSSTTITQSTQNLSLTWASFNIAPQQSVNFIQPSTSAIAVNRILGTSGTQILGYLHSNGQVFLVNPNGIVFGPSAEVNVGGLVASTLELDETGNTDRTKSFKGTGNGSVVNQGQLTAAPGGYVALLGNHVSNQGVISARLGSVTLGAGSAVTLTFDGTSLVRVQVDQSVLKSLAENGGLIHADGGRVIMSAGAKDALMASAVNNTGVIEARTVDTHDGSITLLGGMTAGTVSVAGTLDASAPERGNGGQIETSAAHVEVAGGARVTTAARDGLFGSWLIDPQDYTVAATGGDITGAALSTALAFTGVVLQSSAGATAGPGDVNVNDAVTWSANTTLTLTASNNVNINANITANGNTAGLVINSNTAHGFGTLNLTGASITLSGATPFLSIDSAVYKVINTLGAPGSTTATDLQGMQGNLTGNYALGSDIDASATSTSIWNSGAGFTPIGTPGSPFAGNFNGLGHTISGLTINLPAINDVGLFGYTGTAATVQFVGLVGGSVIGTTDVGSLVGTNTGTVRGSYATGNVTGDGDNVGGLVGSNIGGAISTSHATGNVNGDNTNSQGVGGLVGRNYGSIGNAYATGDVTGGAFYVGGLVGANMPTAFIDNSYATGNVSAVNYVGGLVGFDNLSAVSNSYATGSVSGNGNVGGVVGSNYGSTLSNSYSTGVVSGSGSLGGIAGFNFGTITNSYWNTSVNPTIPGIGAGTLAGATGLTTQEMQSAVNFAGFSFTATPGVGGNKWVMVDADGSLNNAGGTVGATFPMLSSEYSPAISNAHQLQLITMALGTNYRLVANIDAAATDSNATLRDIWSTPGGFVPIGSNSANFAGKFDGLGHTISALTINLQATTAVGLFGITSSNSSIQNVGLVGGSVFGNNFTGSLVGILHGALNNSYSTADVTGSTELGGLVGLTIGSTSAISNSYATGTVTGRYHVGGLVGSAYGGPISNSHATGNVTGVNDVIGGLVGENYGSAISNCYATGNVIGINSVGGLIGEGNGNVVNSYASGNVTGTGFYTGGLAGYESGLISGSHATGNVAGGNYAVGGLVGILTGTITGSYASGNVTGSGQLVGGLVGYNQGAISNSHAGMGTVSGAADYVGGLVGNNSQSATIDGSYATGDVTGTVSVGGLVGSNNAGEISNSFATGSVNGSSYVGGLVGNTNAGTITSSHATGAVNAGSGNGAGGLVGHDGGTLDNSYATGAVNGGMYVGGLVGIAVTQGSNPISNSYATGAVTGSDNVGGLVGKSYFAINNSYATGSVHGSGMNIGGLVGTNAYGATVDNSYSTGTVTAVTSNAGGLAGNNYGGVSNSYATGVVTAQNTAGGLVGLNSNGGAINESYATGNVTADVIVGGLVGDNAGSAMFSFWNKDIVAVGIGAGATAGAQGLTSAGMMTMSNFSSAGWNISDTGGSGDVWRIYAGKTAPLLVSFLTPLTVTAQNPTHIYSGTPVTGFTGATYSVPGAATSGHLFNLANPYNSAVNVGTYSPDLYSDQQGFDIGYVNASLTVTPAALTVSGEVAGSRIYNGTTGTTLTGGSLVGMVPGDIVTLTQAGHFTSADVGTGIAVTVTDAIAGAGAGNYVLTQPTGITANITPATLTYTAAAASFTAGHPILGLNGTLTGFVAGETQINATSGSLSWITTAGQSSAPGHYSINGSGLMATNYLFVDAAANATALTLLAPVSPPTGPSAPAGPTLTALFKARNAVSTIEANLPTSQTNIQLAMLSMSANIAVTESLDMNIDITTQPTDAVVVDKRTPHGAMVPSLQVVDGGVKLPDNYVGINAH